jgi:hypothetical protein
MRNVICVPTWEVDDDNESNIVDTHGRNANDDTFAIKAICSRADQQILTNLVLLVFAMHH